MKTPEEIRLYCLEKIQEFKVNEEQWTCDYADGNIEAYDDIIGFIFPSAGTTVRRNV